MKSILISIQPKYVAKILNGEKTIEIRKTMPKCDLPIDVYIYCTKDKKCLVAPFHFKEGWKYKEYNDNTTYANGCLRNMGDDINGKVVAKFTLNKVEEIKCSAMFNVPTYNTKTLFERQLCIKSCLGIYDIGDYLGHKTGYAWHISNLVIFDKPKELTDFYKYRFIETTTLIDEERQFTPYLKLTKAPQSWCYVESED